MLVTCVTAWIDANKEWTVQKAGAYVSPASPEGLTQTHKGPDTHLSQWHRDEHWDGSHPACLSAWTTFQCGLATWNILKVRTTLKSCFNTNWLSRFNSFPSPRICIHLGTMSDIVIWDYFQWWCNKNSCSARDRGISMQVFAQPIELSNPSHPQELKIK